MPLRILALILVVAIQAAPVHAQHTEPGTGYWYEGVVTHGQGKATVESNEPRPLQEAMEALAKEYGWTIDYEDPAYSADEGVRGLIRNLWQAIRARNTTWLVATDLNLNFPRIRTRRVRERREGGASEGNCRLR
jgi:hypothetical protein